MEIYNTTILGKPVHVIFHGDYYIFVCEAYGYIGVAKRSQESSQRMSDSSRPQKFTVWVGNRRMIGGQLTANIVYEAIKRFINKSENKFIPMKVVYERINKDLSASWMDINMHI